MKVKTYRAPTMKQALEEVKKDLGPDAFILSGKEVKPKKVMGMFSRNYFEVAAAVDYSKGDEKRIEEKKSAVVPNRVELEEIKDRVKLSAGVARKNAPRRPEPSVVAAPPAAEAPRPKPVFPAAAVGKVPAPALATPRPAPAAEPAALLKEIQDLKNMIQVMPSNDLVKTVCWLKPRQFRNAVQEEVFVDLLTAGIEDGLAYELVDDAFYEEVYSDLLSSEPGTGEGATAMNLHADAAAHPRKKNLTRRITDSLCRRIKISDDLIIPKQCAHTQVLALLGPTGVGKTTTLAKLAAKALLEDRMKVGLITLDTFRIAAVDQLRTYAEIIGVPIKVVENATQMDLAIRSFEDKDLVLVDTAGRSQRNLEAQGEMARYFRKSAFIKKVLLLSATTKQSDVADIIEKYKIFTPSSLIFTKLDETQVYGNLLSELVRTSSPLSYLTVGQNVPRDILKADSQRIVGLALGRRPNRWEEFVGSAN